MLLPGDQALARRCHALALGSDVGVQAAAVNPFSCLRMDGERVDRVRLPSWWMNSGGVPALSKGLTRNNRSTVLDSGLLSFVIGDGYQ
jgi:hypothetical protein